MASFWEIQRVEAPNDLLDDMATYVSVPNTPGKLPAVIVVQEVFGVNGNIQSIADRFAAAGYFAVAPAMFHREGTTEGIRGTNPVYPYDDPDARAAAVANWQDDTIILDINTTLDWLRSHPRVMGDKIGIVGFCAGGRITYLAASACPGLAAAVDYYGGNCFRALGSGPSPFDRTAPNPVSCHGQLRRVGPEPDAGRREENRGRASEAWQDLRLQDVPRSGTWVPLR